MIVHGQQVLGILQDGQTRCRHYHEPTDVIAIKMACCDTYYACHACHEQLADHPATTWPREMFHRRAVLCGRCGETMTIDQYLACAHQCPSCRAQFNPGCSAHHALYFQS